MENKYQKAIKNTREDLASLAGAIEYGSTSLALLEETVKIATLLLNKEGWIKSNSGRYMLLKISGIHYKNNRFMVNGYCNISDNSRCVPLDKVYLERPEESKDD